MYLTPIAQPRRRAVRALVHALSLKQALDTTDPRPRRRAPRRRSRRVLTRTSPWRHRRLVRRPETARTHPDRQPPGVHGEWGRPENFPCRPIREQPSMSRAPTLAWLIWPRLPWPVERVHLALVTVEYPRQAALPAATIIPAAAQLLALGLTRRAARQRAPLQASMVRAASSPQPTPVHRLAHRLQPAAARYQMTATKSGRTKTR